MFDSQQAENHKSKFLNLYVLLGILFLVSLVAVVGGGGILFLLKFFFFPVTEISEYDTWHLFDELNLNGSRRECRAQNQGIKLHRSNIKCTPK